MCEMTAETKVTVQETISQPASLQSVQLSCAEPGDNQCPGGLRHPLLVLHLDPPGLGRGDVDLQSEEQHPPLPGPRPGTRPPGLHTPAASPLLSQVGSWLMEYLFHLGNNLLFLTILLLRSDQLGRGRNERTSYCQHFLTKIFYDVLCVLGLTSTVASLRGNVCKE